MSGPHHLLLLAGSGEGRAVAAALAGGALRVTASLAQADHWSGSLPVPTRHGGFGGDQGFADCLDRDRITAVLDATHPFAQRISARSWAVCQAWGLPYLHLDRPAWQAAPGDRWTEVPDAAAAAALVPPGARVFTTLGRPLLGPFKALTRTDIFARRLTDRCEPAPLPHIRYVSGTGPFSMQEEMRIFRDLGITHLICKNSGGQASRTKLDAARQLGLPVILLQRPPATGAPLVRRVDDALAWVERTCR